MRKIEELEQMSDGLCSVLNVLRFASKDMVDSLVFLARQGTATEGLVVCAKQMLVDISTQHKTTVMDIASIIDKPDHTTTSSDGNLALTG